MQSSEDSGQDVGMVANYAEALPGAWEMHEPDNTSSARRMASSGMLRHMALVRTDVSEELSASIIRVTRIGDPILSP
jgi:hypothetical protein